MRRDKEIIKLVMVLVTLYYWVCENGVKGAGLPGGVNILKNDTSKEDSYRKYKTSVEDNDKILDEYNESTDDTDSFDDDLDIDSDEPSTLYKRVQEMPLKLGLQLLTAKYGISESLDKARLGGAHIYEGAKDALKTMADFVGDGISNAKFLLFGSK